jgi:membrane protease YdiL (CAAX protease family)
LLDAWRSHSDARLANGANRAKSTGLLPAIEIYGRQNLFLDRVSSGFLLRDDVASGNMTGRSSAPFELTPPSMSQDTLHEPPQSGAAREARDAATFAQGAPSPKQILFAAIAFEGGIGVLAVVLGWLFARPVWEAMRWEAAAVLWTVVATLPLAVMLVAIDRWPIGPLRGLKRLVDETLVPMFSGCRIWHFALISALAGIGEELLFRGLIQASFVGWLGTWPAIIAASLLFGLAHPLSKTYIAAATAIGVYLGWLFVATGNLLVPILVHALYDFVALVYMTRQTVGHAPRAEIPHAP